MNGALDRCRPVAGDAAAQFGRAADLLALADSPESFASGTALVERAAQDGHADALCMLATLEAIGAGRRRDWHRAFDCLRRAADRGSDHAGAQLRLLRRSGGGQRQADNDGAGIDLARLLRVPERIALSERPRLRVFRGFADPAECAWVVARLRHKLAPAMVWDETSGASKVDPARSGSAVELRLTEMDVVTAILRARIAAATGLPEPIFEIPQLMHYSVAQEFRPHLDCLDPGQPGHAADLARRGQRIGTFLIWLNEDFEGGETEFPKAGLRYRGRTGDALFFANVTPDGRPDPLTLHAGRPPVAGEKWLFSQWIRDRMPAP
jgi:prolyl 4-hydroxylase